jgi:hypothetical protein
MTVGIEGKVNAGVPYLVSNVCRRLAIGDQLTREEMSEIVKSRPRHSGSLHDRPPDVFLKIVRCDEPVTVSGEYES